MPPTFLYLGALAIWLVGAACVWCVAGVLALFRRTRQRGLATACAMAGTFPGVIAYQILSVPFALLILLGILLFWKVLEPGDSTVTENPAVIIATIVGALAAFMIVLTASLAGFWEGWRAGWGFAMGQSISASLRTGPLSRLTVWARRRIRARTGSADSAA